MMSKSPPMEVCTMCGELRQVHQRKPVVLCKNCYQRTRPPTRPMGICANFENCTKRVQLQPIRGRGLCSACYQFFRLRGRLNEWPTIKERKTS
jgi:hypothetical protein